MGYSNDPDVSAKVWPEATLAWGSYWELSEEKKAAAEVLGLDEHKWPPPDFGAMGAADDMVMSHKGGHDDGFGEETPDAGFMWEEESCPLSSTFMNDMVAIRSVVNLGAEISIPWLLVHGTEDDVVPIGDTHDIIAKAKNSPEVVEIAGANHVFSDDALPLMVAKVVDWVKAQAD